MSKQTDIVAAVEAFGPAYAAAVLGQSAANVDQIHNALAKRFAAMGCGRFLADGNTKRIGGIARDGGQAGITDYSAGSFSAAVTSFIL